MSATDTSTADHADQAGDTEPQPPAADTRRIRIAGGAVAAVAYTIVWMRSLRFDYIEGDDATTVAFHAMGRDDAVVSPFSAYHAGADLLLSLLPASETLLRPLTIGASAIGALVAVLLLFEVARIWISDDPRIAAVVFASPRRAAAAVLVTLAALPELLFLSLMYQPAMIGLALVLGGYLVIHPVATGNVVPGRAQDVRIAAAIVATGLGVSIRWDIGLVALVCVADLRFGTGRHRPRTPMNRLIALWGIGSAAVFAVIVALSPALDIGSVLGVVGGRAGVRPAPSAVVANTIAFATPAAIALGLVGLARLSSSWRRLALAQLGAVAACALIMNWTVPKVFAFAFPMIVTLIAVGFATVATRPGRVAILALVVLVAAPWIIGVRVPPDGERAWGPGFELRQPDTATGAGFAVTLASGTAVPTAEGPRSLWGFGHVLIGGDWAELANERTADRSAAVDAAITRNLPIVQVQGTVGYAIAELARRAHDPARPTRQENGFEVMSLRSDTGDIDVVDVTTFANLLDSPAMIRAIIAATGADEAIVFGYSQSMDRLRAAAPDAVEAIGAEAGLVDLALLARRLDPTAVD